MIDTLRKIVGRRHVLTTPGATRRFRRGFRSGEAPALAVVQPGSLVELWRVIGVCVEDDVALIMQAANTGLTGGSTPVSGYDREVVIINTMRIKGIIPIRGGTQVVCMPGATLHELERLLEPWQREPHSVIGSSCFGASIIGGICNNSGGALIQRGPAYTELALFARITEHRVVEMVNHLGLKFNGDPEVLLARLDRGDVGDDDFTDEPKLRASDPDYSQHVRDTQAEAPARYNGDPRRQFEASGSSGKLVIFAARLDTFAREADSNTIYVGSNDPDRLARLRKIMLASDVELPIAAEYIHKEAFDIADLYGRDTFAIIDKLGTGRLPALLDAKSGFDRVGLSLGAGEDLSDRITQRVARLLPDHLPRRLRSFRNSFEHHLLLRVSSRNVDLAISVVADNNNASAGSYFVCTPSEAAAAFLHRFVVAGAAARYRLINRRAVSETVSLDYALPRNASKWLIDLASPFKQDIVAELRYGHFFCHVFHHDFVVRRGADAAAIKAAMLRQLNELGAACPAEHNVGHHYEASDAQAKFFHELDPRNQLNPGIGQMSRLAFYADEPDQPSAME